MDFFRFGVLLPISIISISCVRPVLCEHPSSGPFSIWCDDLLALLFVHIHTHKIKTTQNYQFLYIDCYENSMWKITWTCNKMTWNLNTTHKHTKMRFFLNHFPMNNHNFTSVKTTIKCVIFVGAINEKWFLWN